MKRIFRGNTTRLADYVSKCIFYVGMGSNDYLNNYFMPTMYSTSYDYTPKTYAALLLQDYSRQLTVSIIESAFTCMIENHNRISWFITEFQELFDLGARKVAVVGVGQIGCIPYELARYNNRSNKNRTGVQCNETINKAIVMFNTGLVQMVKRYNNELHEAKFIYVNTYESSKDLAANAATYGILLQYNFNVYL